ALVFVASQLGSYLHAATERHVRCPEHGELVHLAHTDELPPTTGTTAAAGPDGADALRNGAGAGDGHEHEHCYLCPVSRERLGTVPDGSEIAVAMPAVLAHSYPAVVAQSGQPRYVIAPKTSPPA